MPSKKIVRCHHCCLHPSLFEVAAMAEIDVEKVLSELTLEEEVSLTAG